FSAKWLELLKEIVPHLARAAVLRDATSRAGIGEFAAIQSAAPSLRVELQPVDTSQAGEGERAPAGLARFANCGVVRAPERGCIDLSKRDHQAFRSIQITGRIRFSSQCSRWWLDCLRSKSGRPVQAGRGIHRSDS